MASMTRELPFAMANRSRGSSLVVIGSPASTLRRRWSQGLQGMGAIQKVAERAALERSMATLKPTMLLVDFALLRGGVRDVPALQRLSPSTKIVLLTSTPDEKEAISALKAGAKGYHDNALDPSLLKRAVEVVQKGEIWIARNVIPHLLSELASLTEPRRTAPPTPMHRSLDHLTSREREIAHLIGTGASNKEIASQLNISVKTVKAHLTAIFRKLGLSDRLRLALSVAEHIHASP